MGFTPFVQPPDSAHPAHAPFATDCHPRPTSDTTRQAPLIALVGSDGSGKSTVGQALLAWMRESRPTELCHLGKQTGNIGRAIARWPIVGGRFDKAIAGKAASARNPAGPRASTAIVLYLFSMRRVRRFRRMLRIRARGIAVLTDRFPQIEVPGPMDGPGLARLDHPSAIARMLARRERDKYEWMASYRPDLVIRLNVDLATAISRKRDHRPSSLETKIADLSLLRFGGAPIVDIDSTRPLDAVIAEAKRAISKLLSSRGEGPR